MGAGRGPSRGSTAFIRLHGTCSFGHRRARVCKRGRPSAELRLTPPLPSGDASIVVVRLPSEIAAELRARPNASPPSRLHDELAGAIHALVARTMQKTCTRVGAQAEAEDATQELALKLYQRLAAAEIPPQPGREDPYLQRAARNKAKDILKGKGVFRHRRDRPLEVELFGGHDAFASGEHEALMAKRQAWLHAALGSMSEAHREVIEAYDLRGVPLTEIAEQWYQDGRAETRAKARQNVQKTHSLAIKRLRVLVGHRAPEDDR